ncbi:MAG: GNAT family N-acetyltransferase [Dehalococcoidia bacterium]|nr:GNAT family N-acetyltransferase [Dehalococcoidia bacterium]
MTIDKLTIAEATPQHAPFIAWVTLTAFRSHLERGFWDFMLDGDEAYKLRYLEALTTTEQLHWVHYSTFIVAEVAGRPVSAMGGYFGEELGGPALRMAGIEANQNTGRTEAEGAAGFERAKSIMNVIPEHLPGAWIVENVATVPEFRRRGLADLLMEEILELGCRRGATVSDISVFIGNDGAQRAYEKRGFAVIAERRNPEFESVYGTPGTRTLRRSLGSSLSGGR